MPNMDLFIKAQPNSRNDKVEKIDNNHFIISVKEPPIKGRANQAIIKVLGEYFNISFSKIKIIAGFKSREKILRIDS